MAGLQDIRRRIRSVKNTQQVTKAMKMISAVKLRKSQERLLALRPYATRLNGMVQQVFAGFAEKAPETDSALLHSFLHPPEERRVRLIVVASDKGLCGAFNANVLKAAQHFLETTSAETVELELMGKRAVDWARKMKLKARSERIGLPLAAYLAAAHELATAAIGEFQRGEVDALYIAFNYFNSPVSQVPKVERLFPMAPPAEAHHGPTHLLEPDPVTVLESILPKLVETTLLRCLLESSASENGSRMASMDKATNNASEMIDKLTLHMNKVRQAAITNQIIEVVSGANA